MQTKFNLMQPIIGFNSTRNVSQNAAFHNSRHIYSLLQIDIHHSKKGIVICERKLNAALHSPISIPTTTSYPTYPDISHNVV